MSELVRYHPNYASSRSPQVPGAPAEEAGYYYAEQGEETHLRDYWKILLKRVRVMIPIFVGVVAIGILINWSLPTLYTARSTLKIEPQNPSVTGVGGVAELTPAQQDTGPYDYYQTQFALLKSGPLAARVVKNLRLDSNRAFTDKSGSSNIFSAVLGWIPNSIEWVQDLISRSVGGDSEPAKSEQGVTYELGVAPYLIGRYLRYLEVDPVRNTRLVNIVFKTPDPKLSQDLANTHATSFIQMILENRFNLTKEARDFLRTKLAELRDKVAKAERQLNAFRQQHGVVSLEKGENIVVERLVDLNKELTRARAERIQSESLYRMTRNKNTQYLAQVLNNSLIQQLKGTLAGLETEKGRLSSIYTPEHPRIKELNQQIGEAKRALSGEVSNIVNGIESSYAAARAREDALEAEAKRQQETALNLKEVGVDYAVLNEEVAVNRGLYDSVLKRLNETNVGNDLAASNIQVVQPADLPVVPSSPDTMRNLLFSILLGLVLAVAYAFFSEYMDATVNTPQGVWAAVSLTTLGVVPHLKSLHERYHPVLSQNVRSNRLDPPQKSGELLSKELVVARDQLSMIAESYRTIRTALLLSQAEQPPKVILLTSPCPSEGKTVTTLNLGIALAQSGKRVLVIDADLRKGRCHKLVNVENRGGLTNVLTGHLDLEDGIQPTAIRNFFLMPRGVLPPNPADLLMSHKMQDVLNQLRASFDFVVIDSPPIIAVSDATVLSALCDGVLLVFNGQKTTTPAARRAVERLESVGAPLIGVILNGIDVRDPDYVDYRSYYPSYYATVREESEPTVDEQDGVIQSVDDVDRLMSRMGFPRGEEHGPLSNGAGAEPATPDGKRFVPRLFFDRMVLKLSEALGPAAFTIVRKQVDTLSEPMDAFPVSRVWELAQLVSQEILDNQLKVRFLHAMSEEIRELKAA